MKNIQKGFTLIELMIVVAIIAILAAIAIPQYQNYIIRTQVSEGMNLADGAKTAVAEFYNNKGKYPANNGSAGLPATAASISGKYVQGVTNTSGVIVATFGNESNSKLNGKIIALSPYDLGGSISWNCKAASTGAAAAKGTYVDEAYLPTSCRK
ncbi:type IV pilus assembly protein PilA [Luteibacter rhizovicinus]|uniref:Type IV pilus assembly protein PilA n=1 Tax=Luteibacter rhizovicinus TaxID=242606 RepID=A0A4V2W4B0_9GAMM|nr:pilin [Luteibacter rhizovicinus]TCV94949.1 type IV pilus assembly protein PilA [Luteibacter rhizovicinus]